MKLYKVTNPMMCSENGGPTVVEVNGKSHRIIRNQLEIFDNDMAIVAVFNQWSYFTVEKIQE